MSTFLQVLLGSVAAFGVIVLLAGLAARWVVRRVLAALPSRRAPRQRAALRPRVGPRPGAAAVLGLAGRSVPALTVRASLPGRSRQVARVRLALRDDVRGAGQALSMGQQAQRPVEGLHTVMQQLREQARALDVDLSVIAREPDRRIRRELLAAQQDRLMPLSRACGEVRRAVLLSGSLSTAPLLRSIESDLEDEVTALALRVEAMAELTRS